MKKRTVLIFIVVALIVGIVATPAAAAGYKLTLLSAQIERGQSVFAFKLDGDRSKFTGTAYYGGEAYPLTCKLRDKAPDILLCRGNKVLADKFVQVVVNGRSWTTFVVGKEYCYPVYDWPDFGVDGPWDYYGDHCQDTPASLGDFTDHYTIDSATKFFHPFGGFCGPGGSYNDYGPGFYYPECVGGA